MRAVVSGKPRGCKRHDERKGWGSWYDRLQQEKLMRRAVLELRFSDGETWPTEASIPFSAAEAATSTRRCLKTPES